MRVLHVIPAIARRYGGPSTVVLDTCRSLAARGHDVVLATSDADGAGRLPLPLGRMTRYEDVDVICFPRTSSEAFKWTPALAAWLRAHVSDFDVVDIHAVFSHSSLAAGRACRARSVPYVVRPHGALDPWSLSRKSWQKRVLFAAGVRRLLTDAAAIQYTTPEEQRMATNRLRWLSRGVVVPLGVPAACVRSGPASPASPPYVLTMSRLEPKKGLERLLRAFHAAAIGPRAAWRLIVAGHGDDGFVRSLRAVAADGAAAARIAFVGWVDGAEKATWIQGASLFASPSEQENFCLSVVEAMAAGVPVLVSPTVNLAPDIAAAGAGWIVDRDVAALSHALEAICDADAVRAERGLAASALARGFTWEQAMDALEAVYRAIVGRSRHAGGVA